MQKYKILEFRSNFGAITFTRNEQTGLYVTEQGEVKSHLDFICKQNYYVHSIKRNASNQNHTPTNELIITVGESYLIDNRVRIISKLVFNKGELHVLVHNDNTLYHHLSVNPIPVANFTARNINTVPIANGTVIGNNVIANDQFFTSLQTRILNDNPRPIRLERTLKRRTETPKQFLEKFFKVWNEVDEESIDFSETQSAKDTVYVDDFTVQTVAGKRRSLGDIFMIMRYYYPTITLKEVMKLLYIDLVTNSSISDSFRTSKCNTINKRVWYYDYESTAGIYDRTARDEYGNDFNSYLNKLV